MDDIDSENWIIIDSPKDSPKDCTKDYPKDSPKDCTKDSPKDCTKDSPIAKDLKETITHLKETITHLKEPIFTPLNDPRSPRTKNISIFENIQDHIQSNKFKDVYTKFKKRIKIYKNSSQLHQF